MSYDSLFKLVLVGDVKTGKSAFIQRLVTETPSQIYHPTIGVDFRTTVISHCFRNIKLQIWDTSGQERFRDITKSYFRGADAVIFIFDLTDRESFNNIDMWCEIFKETRGTEFNALILGNKNDLVNERQVTSEEAKDLARRRGMDYLEVSARNDQATRCRECLESLVDSLVYEIGVKKFWDKRTNKFCF